MKAERTFLARDTRTVARDLLGCHLVRRVGDEQIRIRLTETEAYRGTDDPASHASRAVTPRNRFMFGEVGILYVYLIYGLHHCMNIIAHEDGGVGAVLLRGGELLEGHEDKLVKRIDGPGRLAKAMGIDLQWNGHDLMHSADQNLWLERAETSRSIQVTPRIGITKAVDYPWRYVLE
ncbi:DNA-3-methyladenine glycosylase [Paenibacillus sp. GCM10023252]|uniref:DNA-3-methyladenine glycosylase n=1 Tax=Paenibacillus sp. GCM10023252 TaxID=3252649 RepID=UPI003612EFF3